jgi:16S rRNA (cytosine967-C5)-methyltransferase
LRENCARLGATCVEITSDVPPALRADPPSVDSAPESAAGEEAHLDTTTRSPNSLAPRSGERARETGSFPPTVEASKRAPVDVAPALFDRIMLDAPCSNSGVLRRRVDLRWRIREAELARLSREQGALLRQAAAQLKPGGRLVYSTCSLEPEENETVTRQFLAEHPEFTLDSERQLLPFRDQVDGAYVAAMRSRESH